MVHLPASVRGLRGRGLRRDTGRTQGDRRLESHAGIIVAGTPQHVREPAGLGGQAWLGQLKRLFADRCGTVPECPS